jgi:hypothetical protein
MKGFLITIYFHIVTILSMEENRTCKDCELVLHNLVKRYYCGHNLVRNDSRLKNRELNDFIKDNVIPNFCPLKQL